MHGKKAERRNIFEREIAVADGVEAVGSDARKTEVARERLAVERKSAAGERTGTERAGISAGGSGGDLLAFFVRKNSGGGDGAGPGAVEREFLREKAAIEMPGALELVEGGVRGTVEAAAPHLLVFGAAHLTSAFARATFGTVTGGTVMGSAKRLMKPSAS